MCIIGVDDKKKKEIRWVIKVVIMKMNLIVRVNIRIVIVRKKKVFKRDFSRHNHIDL